MDVLLRSGEFRMAHDLLNDTWGDIFESQSRGGCMAAGVGSQPAAAGIRALRTVARSALAVIGSSVMFGDVNWLLVGSTAALAGVTRILTSIVTGLPEAGVTKEKL